MMNCGQSTVTFIYCCSVHVFLFHPPKSRLACAWLKMKKKEEEKRPTGCWTCGVHVSPFQEPTVLNVASVCVGFVLDWPHNLMHMAIPQCNLNTLPITCWLRRERSWLFEASNQSLYVCVCVAVCPIHLAPSKNTYRYRSMRSLLGCSHKTCATVNANWSTRCSSKCIERTMKI